MPKAAAIAVAVHTSVFDLLTALVQLSLPLLFHRAIKGTPLIALYVRPKMFRFGSGKEKLEPAAA